MKDERFTLFDNLVESVLATPGETSSSLRTALFQHIAQLSDSPLEAEAAIPEEMNRYVTKVATHAYQVTDQDIEHLRLSGYNEDALFEITLSIALGAGARCLSQGMKAIKGAKNALEEH